MRCERSAARERKDGASERGAQKERFEEERHQRAADGEPRLRRRAWPRRGGFGGGGGHLHGRCRVRRARSVGDRSVAHVGRRRERRGGGRRLSWPRAVVSLAKLE